MEKIIDLLFVISIILLGLLFLVGIIGRCVTKKKVNPKEMATPEYASELQSRFTPPPTRKTPNQLRAEYGFPPIINDPWNAISRSPIGILHVSDSGMKIEEIKPSATAILMETLDLRKRVENTRMLYEHRPEFIGKNDLYDLMNRLDKELIEHSSDLYSVNECSKHWKKLFETTETRLTLMTKDCERWKKMYDLMEHTWQDTNDKLKSVTGPKNADDDHFVLPACCLCVRNGDTLTLKCGEDNRFNCPRYVKNAQGPSVDLTRNVGIFFKKEN